MPDTTPALTFLYREQRFSCTPTWLLNISCSEFFLITLPVCFRFNGFQWIDIAVKDICSLFVCFYLPAGNFCYHTLMERPECLDGDNEGWHSLWSFEFEFFSEGFNGLSKMFESCLCKNEMETVTWYQREHVKHHTSSHVLYIFELLDMAVSCLKVKVSCFIFQHTVGPIGSPTISHKCNQMLHQKRPQIWWDEKKILKSRLKKDDK